MPERLHLFPAELLPIAMRNRPAAAALWLTHLVLSRLLCICTMGLALLVASASSAQPSEDDRWRALELGRHGVELYNQRRWVEAYDRFSQAEAIVHSPVFVLYMARAKRQLGSLVEAETLCRRVMDEPLPEDAPPQWVDARRDAAEEHRALQPLIPKLTIQLQVPSEARTRVWIDEREVSGRELPLAVDPGRRRVSAQCESGEPMSRVVKLAAGEHQVLTLAPACVAAVPVGSVPPSPPPSAIDADPGGSLRVGGVVLMIVGGASLAVGIGTGIGAIALDSDLADACNDDLVCPPDRQPDVDTYYALAHTSTATLAIGAAAFAAGLITYLVAPAGGEAPVAATPSGLVVRFW